QRLGERDHRVLSLPVKAPRKIPGHHPRGGLNPLSARPLRAPHELPTGLVRAADAADHCAERAATTAHLVDVPSASSPARACTRFAALLGGLSKTSSASRFSMRTQPWL